jgi:polysaccharide export outer membrane protein
MPETTRLVWHVLAVSALAIGVSTATNGQQGAAVAANIEESPYRVPRTQASTAVTASAVPEGLECLPLAPGFLLQMDLYGIPEMATRLWVDDRGAVTIPLLGALHLAGETLPQAQSTIARALTDRELFNDPQVTLQVVQYPARAVSVMGEVQTPGRFPVLIPTPLIDVLALAGGETLAASDDIEIQRHEVSGEASVHHLHFVQHGDPAILRSTFVGPGDSIFVHRAGIVYVLGAVHRPGGYLMVNSGSLNVAQALALAGGTTPQSSTRWAVIVRNQGDRIEQIKVPLGRAEKGQAPPAALQRNDVLYVSASGWKSLVVNGSNVLSAAAAASIYAAGTP